MTRPVPTDRPSPLAEPRLLLPLAAAALALLVAAPPAAAAPDPAPAPPQPQQESADRDDAQEAGEEELTRKERRQLAKQKRIEEYLAKKEARRAEREARRHSRAMEEAAEAERRAVEEQQSGLEAEARPAPEEAELERARRRLPRRLARVQQTVRESKVGADPTVQQYLDRIDLQEASPQQLAAFGNFIAENGLIEEALEYYRIAVGIDRKDPVLWLNQGILLRRIGDAKSAVGSFSQALSIDPNNAAAHYNLGAALDELGNYDEALEEYKIALRLDPSLGDPSVNPQAANNNRLTAVKLMLYREQGGATTLPLASVPGGRLEERPER